MTTKQHMPTYHGQGNSGPAREVWADGGRVMFAIRGRDYGCRGTITPAPRDPDASQTEHVWVRWDDGKAGYVNPNNLDVE